eukprot:874454-Rhodomonas_salina.1
MASLVGALLPGAPATGPTAGRSMAACTIPSNPAASAASAAPPLLSSDDDHPYRSPLSFRAARNAGV